MKNKVMAKAAFFLSFLVLLVSCVENKEELGNGDGAGDITILARIEDYGNSVTRTVVENNKKVHWEQSDRLGVYGAQSQNVLFTYSTSQGDGAEFTGQFSKKEEPIFAYYPYRKDTEKNGNLLTVVLPSECEYTGGSNAPMIGLKNDGGEFVFKHVCGLMRITVNNLPDDAEHFVITSSGADAPDIAGEAIVQNVTENDAILVLNGEGSRSVTYRLGALKNGSGFRSFFIPLPVGTYPELQVSLYGAGRTEPYFTRSITDVDMRRALMTEVPIIDAGTGADYVLGENTKIMSDAVSAEVVQSESDNTVLVYGAGVSASEVPQEGTIVLARASRTLPCGFLGRVTDVRKNGDGSHTVNTEKVALSEAFDQLYVDETVDLVPENTSGANTRGLLGNIFYEGDLNLELGVNGSSAGGHYAKGSVRTKLALTVNINVDKEKKIGNGAFTLTGNMNTAVDIGVKYKGEKEAKLVETELGELKFGSIPVAGGLILLFPTYAPHFMVKASGEIENTVGLESESQFVVGAEFRDGKWRMGTRKMPQANAESPWHFQGHLTFRGSLSAGLDNSINLKLYGRDDMKVSFEPETGCELAGEIDINEENKKSLVKILSETTFSSNLYLQGSIKVDASLLVPGTGLEGECLIGKASFFPKEIQLLPLFKKLEAKTQTAGGDNLMEFNADVETEVSGELITKNAQVSLVLADGQDNNLKEGERIAYNGGKTQETDPDVAIPLDSHFNGLEEGNDYKAYPVVVSPIFEEVAEGGRIELKELAVPLEYHTPERDILIAFYKATNGDNWTNKDNWCSEQPLDAWYGVRMADGRVTELMLDDNNLTGVATLGGLSKLINLTLSGNHFTGVDFRSLPNLYDLRLERNDCITSIDLSHDLGLNGILVIGSNPKLTTLNLQGLTKLSDLFIENNESLLPFDCSGLVSLQHFTLSGCPSIPAMEFSNFKNVEQINVTDNSNLSSLKLFELPNLKYLYCERNALTALIVENLPKLKDMRCSNNKLISLEMSNLPNLDYGDCSFNQLTSLRIVDLPKLSTFWCNDNLLTSIEIKDKRTTRPWLSVGCNNNKLSSVDLRGVNGWNSFSARNNPLKVIYLRKGWGNLFPSDYDVTFWGTQDEKRYKGPEHRQGWQYPRFVYE